MGLNIEKIRSEFPIFSNVKDIIYFDNASTTHKPKIVLNEILDYYTTYNTNVHRGVYDLAEKATLKYENSRKIIADFINADNHEIVFTKSTTESINIVSNSLGLEDLAKNDEIILSEMEHHSNIIPWQILSKKCSLNLRYIPLNSDGELDIEQLQKLINSKTKFISITHMSNVIGSINPIEKITKLANDNNIKILIDAAQSISHLKIDVKKINCDYLVFSGHKIMGPTGVGVLYAKKNILEKTHPLLGGGHMIREVHFNSFTLNDSPWKFEAGTPNIAQAIGLGAAIKFFQKYNLNDLHDYTNNLCEYLLKKLKNIPNITIYPKQQNRIGPVVSFTIKNIPGYDLTKLLGTYNICIRSGHHCSQPLLRKYNQNSLNRVSLYFYNTQREIDVFYEKLKEVIKILL